MCGLLYANLKNPNPAFLNVFEDALQLMNYRGGDALGYYQLSTHYFGHARLSILDLSARSNQPIVGNDSIILFKGEIYNYKSLSPSAESDTLAIRKLVESGKSLTNKLTGMYGILIYNKWKDSVTVLRDFYGEKPIYYYLDENVFLVSSTIKSIIFILQRAFQKQLKINPLAIYDYFLSGYVREPRTIYEGIETLSSAHELIFSNWQITLNNHFESYLKNEKTDPTRYANQCISTMDVEPGLLLSGGVDSTYILNLMHPIHEEFSVLTYRTKNKAIDESDRALSNMRKMCNDEAIKLQVLENSQHVLNLYQDYPSILEQPSSDGLNLFNILSVSRTKTKNLKVILMGTGGDELYGGYPTFTNYNMIAVARKFHWLKNIFPKKYRRFYTLRDPEENVSSYYYLYRLCPFFLPLVSTDIIHTLYSSFKDELAKYQIEGSAGKKIKLLESFDYMRNQLLRDADNISLYFGFEVRNPLLSVQAFHLEPDFKRAMKKELHNKYGIRFQKKRGFTYCDKENNIRSFLQQSIQAMNESLALLSPAVERRLLENTQLSDSVLRKIYFLLAWLSKNVTHSSQLNYIQI